MRKNATDRYQSWIDFGKDLSKAFGALRLAGETISDSAKFNELKNTVVLRGLRRRRRCGRRCASARGASMPGEHGDHPRGRPRRELLPAGRGRGRRVDRRHLDQHRSAAAAASASCSTSATRSRSGRRPSRRSADITVIEIKTIALKVASSTCQVSFQKAFMRVLIDRLTQANAKLAPGPRACAPQRRAARLRSGSTCSGSRATSRCRASRRAAPRSRGSSARSCEVDEPQRRA